MAGNENRTSGSRLRALQTESNSNLVQVQPYGRSTANWIVGLQYN